MLLKPPASAGGVVTQCVVTGGCGFIGSHVVDALAARGDAVTVLDDLSSGTVDHLNARADLRNGSILDAAMVDGAVRGADCIFHLAAWAWVPRSIEDPLGTHQVNVIGTLNLLEAARRHGVPRFVYASSSSVYGNQATHLLHEGMTPDPLSPYGLQKLVGEQYCTLYSRMCGMTGVSLRCFNIYGPRQVGGEVRHIYPNPRGAFEERRKAADYSRAKALLGWQPAVSFRPGLTLTYPDLAGPHSAAPRSLP